MMRSLTLLVLVICVGLSLSATPVRRPHSPGSGPSSSSGSYSTSSNGHPIWVNCGAPFLQSFSARDSSHPQGANNDHYKIYSVSVSPSSPRIGHNITISIDGQLDETVSFGYGSVVLNWNGYPILNCTKDLCVPPCSSMSKVSL